jgi:hypothetical protein
LIGDAGYDEDRTMLDVLIQDAIRHRFSLTAHYEDHVRFFSPHAIGTDGGGAVVVLAYQYGGGRRGGLPVSGGWACFYAADLWALQRNTDKWIPGPIAAKPMHVLKRIDLAA